MCFFNFFPLRLRQRGKRTNDQSTSGPTVVAESSSPGCLSPRQDETVESGDGCIAQSLAGPAVNPSTSTARDDTMPLSFIATCTSADYEDLDQVVRLDNNCNTAFTDVRGDYENLNELEESSTNEHNYQELSQSNV